MKVFLIRKEKLEFQVTGANRCVPWMFRVGEVDIVLSAKKIAPWTLNVHTVLYKKLKEFLELQTERRTLTAYFSRLTFSQEDAFNVTLSSDILPEMAKYLGGDLHVQVALDNTQVIQQGSKDDITGIKQRIKLSCSQTSGIFTKATPVSCDRNEIHYSVAMPDAWGASWPKKDVLKRSMEDLLFSANLNVILSLPDSRSSTVLLQQEVPEVNKQILKEVEEADVEIVCSNGATVKCHSIFLSVQSEVIKAMLNSDLGESNLKIIKLDDVSEEGVKALLAFLYYRCLDVPQANSFVAVELLKAAEKYMIGALEDAVKSVIADKPEKWFSVEAALMLYLFVGNLTRHRNFKTVTRAVLKSNMEELTKSQMYARLLEENPSTAKQITRKYF